MSNVQGFEIYINNKKYLVRAGLTRLKSTGCYGVSNEVTMFITVYDENNKMIRLDKDSYAAEKIGDFIKNSVNGQDSCYWSFDKPNRHFKEESEESSDDNAKTLRN